MRSAGAPLARAAAITASRISIAAWTRACGVMSRARSRRGSLPHLVVGSLAGDRHVVDVAFLQAGIGDLHELGRSPQFLDGGAAGVAHCRLDPADQLVDHV